jgi:hypothetical protein
MSDTKFIKNLKKLLKKVVDKKEMNW